MAVLMVAIGAAPIRRIGCVGHKRRSLLPADFLSLIILDKDRIGTADVA